MHANVNFFMQAGLLQCFGYRACLNIKCSFLDESESVESNGNEGDALSFDLLWEKRTGSGKAIILLF